MSDLVGKKVQWTHRSKRGSVYTLSRKTGIVESVDGDTAHIRTSPKAKRVFKVPVSQLRGVDEKSELTELVEEVADSLRQRTGIHIAHELPKVDWPDELVSEPAKIYGRHKFPLEKFDFGDEPDGVPAGTFDPFRLQWKVDGNYHFAPFISLEKINIPPELGTESYAWEISILDMPVAWGSSHKLEVAKRAAEDRLIELYNELRESLGNKTNVVTFGEANITPAPWKWEFIGTAGNYFLSGSNGYLTGNGPDTPDGKLKAAAPLLLDACETLWQELANKLAKIEVHPGFLFADDSPCTVNFLDRIVQCNSMTEAFATCDQLMAEAFPDVFAAIAAAKGQVQEGV